jgi:hypothetical protein
MNINSISPEAGLILSRPSLYSQVMQLNEQQEYQNTRQNDTMT